MGGEAIGLSLLAKSNTEMLASYSLSQMRIKAATEVIGKT